MHLQVSHSYDHRGCRVQDCHLKDCHLCTLNCPNAVTTVGVLYRTPTSRTAISAPSKLLGGLSVLRLAVTTDRINTVNLLLASGAPLPASLLQEAWQSPDVTHRVLAFLTTAYCCRLRAEQRRLKKVSSALVEGIDNLNALLRWLEHRRWREVELGAGQEQDHTKELGAGQERNHAKELGTGQDQNHTKKLGAGQEGNHAKELGVAQEGNHTKELGAAQERDHAKERPSNPIDDIDKMVLNILGEDSIAVTGFDELVEIFLPSENECAECG
ncbi:hypothetical protein O3P69_015607 [Scylla paramamosain]|uniref:Uncharacterized protein n=1 Tax=Scylla paramamosain TaxID=85552 RepID=A0AAW0SIC2_SCYPA